jgi:penicillin-binding protein 1C
MPAKPSCSGAPGIPAMPAPPVADPAEPPAAAAPPRRWSRALLPAAALALLLPYLWQVAGRAHLDAPAPTPFITDRHGAFLTQIGHETREPVGLRVEYGYWQVAPLPDRVVRATLALEDRRFWQHPGIDPVAVLRAGWQNLSSGQRRSGASTLAMQVARMQQPAARTPWAKAVEAGTALALTLRYGREALLAQYLRLVPYGNGSHGIAHAARFYLDKPVQDLGWAEIALLSAIPQAPALHNPLRPAGLDRARARGQRALLELARQGMIDPAELAVAQAQLAALALPPAPRRPPMLHAVLRLRGMLAAEGLRGLDPADPRIRTGLDLGIQRDVAALARQHLAEWRGGGAEQVAVMVVRRDTREVLASLGSASYGYSRGGAFDFTRAMRSPGSTMKPFLFALALEQGRLTPDEVMQDLPDGASGIGNADGSFLGPLLPRQALANSRNVPAVTLLRRLGLENGFRLLRELGLHDAGQTAERFGLSLAIGALPSSLDRLVTAYGALADDGMLRPLLWYGGQPAIPPRRVLAEAAARQVTLFLSDPQARLPSFPRYGSTEYPFPVALKTGTSQGYRDAWTIAWSGSLMVGVWVGRADAGPMAGLGGARSAARLAQAILLRQQGSSPDALVDGGFPPPAGTVPVLLCATTGLPATADCARSLVEYLPRDGAAPAPPAPPRPPPLSAAAPAPPLLSIAAPEHNGRVWRNPELPAPLNRLPLRASVSPAVPQVVWYVDGEPFALADPAQTVYWPLRPGAHRFQLRLPGGEAASSPVRIVVE